MPDLSGEGAQGDLHCPAIADDPGLAVAAVQSELAQKRSAPDATRSMPVSFHGLGSHELARHLPHKQLCATHDFFRILEGSMTMHTIQGDRMSHDFMVQMYAVFSEPNEDGPVGVPDRIVQASPAGLPLCWNIGGLDLMICQQICPFGAWMLQAMSA